MCNWFKKVFLNTSCSSRKAIDAAFLTEVDDKKTTNLRQILEDIYKDYKLFIPHQA